MVIFIILKRVWPALRRAFARMLLWFFVVGAIAAVTVELVSIGTTKGHLPDLETHLAAVALGVAVGYAAALTVLVAEMFRDLLAMVHDLEHDIGHGMGAGGTLLRHVSQDGASEVRQLAARLERRGQEP